MRRNASLLSALLVLGAGVPMWAAAPGPFPAGQTEQANAAASADVQAALKTPIDSKHARVGEEITAVTRNESSLNGTRLPKGTALLGHITEVGGNGAKNAENSVGVVFEQARLKDGRTVPVRAVLHSVAPPPSTATIAADDTLPAPNASADAAAGASVRGGGGGGGLLGGALTGTRNTLGGVANTAGNVTSATANTVGRTASTVTGTAATGLSSIPGVSLTTGADASTSGVIAARGHNLHLDSGTQLTLGLSTK